MASVGLLFVGAVLFVNGLLFLGRIDPKGAAVFNLFVGGLQVAVPFYLIATATSANNAATANDILATAGIFLFGFTYLYVGIVNLAGFKAVGIGWYSLWVAMLHHTKAGAGLQEVVSKSRPPALQRRGRGEVPLSRRSESTCSQLPMRISFRLMALTS